MYLWQLISCKIYYVRLSEISAFTRNDFNVMCFLLDYIIYRVYRMTFIMLSISVLIQFQTYQFFLGRKFRYIIYFYRISEFLPLSLSCFFFFLFDFQDIKNFLTMLLKWEKKEKIVICFLTSPFLFSFLNFLPYKYYL